MVLYFTKISCSEAETHFVFSFSPYFRNALRNKALPYILWCDVSVRINGTLLYKDFLLKAKNFCVEFFPFLENSEEESILVV